MTWKVTKSKFYVFSVGNTVQVISSVDVYIFENITMNDMMTVVVLLLQYF